MSVSSYTCVNPTLYVPSTPGAPVVQEPHTGGCLPSTRGGDYTNYNDCFVNCPAERHIVPSDAMRASTLFQPLHPGDNYRSVPRRVAPGSTPVYPWCQNPLTDGWRGEI